MNISEANATARLLAGTEDQADRELLAAKAGKALMLRINPGLASSSADAPSGTRTTNPPLCYLCPEPAQPEHTPCCNGGFHGGVAMCCDHYRQAHFIGTPCSPATHQAANQQVSGGDSQ